MATISASICSHPQPFTEEDLLKMKSATGQLVPMKSTSSVRGPTYVVKRGKPPVLKADEARQLLDSIKIDTIVGLRGRPPHRPDVSYLCPLVGVKVEDYDQNGKRWSIRLHEEAVNASHQS